MPASGKASRVIALVDTSVAIALVLSAHEGHASTIEAVRGYRLGLSGHAWFEAYSVLTRLPSGARRAPAEILALLSRDFPETRFLDGEGMANLREELARLGIAGGSVYDALVGAAARHHGLQLLSRDHRATDTYRALGVDVTLIS